MRAIKRLIAYLFMLALLLFPVWIYLNAQALSDWWQLRNYTPPETIVSLADQSAMTEYGRHVFYVNHPDLESDIGQFRSDCHENEKTIILGCYRSNQLGIFIYDVDDPRLKGVEQVTAAHEMLHAAYDRLSKKDKNHVDGLLQDYFSNQLRDQRIQDTIESYRKSEPKDLINEMHSIFGTEIANLPSQLENHYSKYFTNRRVVTNLANSYQDEFRRREAKIKADDAKLAQMKLEIQALEDDLKARLDQINAGRTQLNSMRRSQSFSAYQAAVNNFNAEVDVYNSGVMQLRNKIAAYNELVAERNKLASELASLSGALDTRLTPQTAQ